MVIFPIKSQVAGVFSCFDGKESVFPMSQDKGKKYSVSALEELRRCGKTLPYSFFKLDFEDTGRIQLMKKMQYELARILQRCSTETESVKRTEDFLIDTIRSPFLIPKFSMKPEIKSRVRMMSP